MAYWHTFYKQKIIRYSETGNRAGEQRVKQGSTILSSQNNRQVLCVSLIHSVFLCLSLVGMHISLPHRCKNVCSYYDLFGQVQVTLAPLVCSAIQQYAFFSPALELVLYCL